MIIEHTGTYILLTGVKVGKEVVNRPLKIIPGMNVIAQDEAEALLKKEKEKFDDGILKVISHPKNEDPETAKMKKMDRASKEIQDLETGVAINVIKSLSDIHLLRDLRAADTRVDVRKAVDLAIDKLTDHRKKKDDK